MGSHNEKRIFEFLESVGDLQRWKSIFNHPPLCFYPNVSEDLSGLAHPPLNVSANTFDHPTYRYLILMVSNVLEDMHNHNIGVKYAGNSPCNT
jgi:hypothetical protein